MKRSRGKADGDPAETRHLHKSLAIYPNSRSVITCIAVEKGWIPGRGRKVAVESFVATRERCEAHTSVGNSILTMNIGSISLIIAESG